MKVTGSHTEPPERKVSKIESKDEEKENASLPSMGSPLRCLRLSCSGGDVSTVSRGARGLLRDAECLFSLVVVKKNIRGNSVVFYRPS